MPPPTPSELIRRLLNDGAELTYAQLRQRTGLGDKQLSRLLAQLRAEGLAVAQRRQGRHKLFWLPADSQQVSVPDLRLDHGEVRALAIAAKASRSVLAGTPHAAALQRAFAHLLEHASPACYLFAVEEPQQEWFFDEATADTILLDCFQKLEAAMDERQTVRFNYHTASTGRHWQGRRLDPYAFVKRQRSWQLVGYCHERQRVQHFALTRVSRVEPCPSHYFEMQPGFRAEDYFRDALGVFASGEAYVLRLLVEPDRALHFRERQYHPTQQPGAEHPDGRLEVSFELEGLDEMRSFCQSWGTGITVLEPAELRERLRQEAEELAARYRTPG